MSNITTAILASLLYGPALAIPAPPTAPTFRAEEESEERVALSEALGAALGETRAMLSSAGIDGVVSGRIKSPESLRAKMRRKGLRADQVLDRLALRVRVETAQECYELLDRLHARFPAVAGSFDDYIVAPKANGYQSLHAALHTPDGVVEFQIRTHEMHAHAETGGAAHWRYKLVSARS